MSIENNIEQWMPEVEWLADHMGKFQADHLKLYLAGKGKEIKPKTTLANVFKIAQSKGLIEPIKNDYAKSNWASSSSRAVRQFWRKSKAKKR
jgi:hypothetical protein